MHQRETKALSQPFENQLGAFSGGGASSYILRTPLHTSQQFYWPVFNYGNLLEQSRGDIKL
jgi:hypothetical protein